ncbi:thioesterase domain-containing protein, partial [Dyella humi]
PAAFVQLDALPLTPNGKLDRKALPAPDDAALARQAYEAPQGELETTLVEIWQALLKIEQVGIVDDFFALGGDSLLATRLLSRFREVFPSTEYSMRAFFEAPTIKAAAERIRSASIKASPGEKQQYPLQSEQELNDGGAKKSFAENVVLIRHAGNAPIVFLIHPGGGEIVYARLMANTLQRGYSIYGIAAPDVQEGQVIAKTIEEIATNYLVAMRRIQPTGPYRLGGWSLGGIIAFEMAHQLVAMGEEIEFLGLIDTSYQFVPPQDSPDEISIGNLALRAIPPDASADQRATFATLAEKNDIEEMYRYAYTFKWIDNYVPIDAYMRNLNARYAENYAASQYTPQLGNFPMVHFCATENPYSSSKRWVENFPNKLMVVPVPGDHLSMMKPPHIQSLCNAFDKALKHFAVAFSGEADRGQEQVLP